MSSSATITAVIVDYFTRPATLELVNDLVMQPGIQQIIVVDNSGDPGYAEKWPVGSGIQLLISPSRQGYGAGANVGANAATGDLLLILNSDLRVGAGEFVTMAASMSIHDGVVGPLILDPQGFPQRDAWGPLPMVGARIGEVGPPRWITGACMMLRRDVFLRIGGFDERYFMYWEDVDLCRKLWDSQLGVRLYPHVVLRHLSGHSQSSSTQKYRHATRSRNLYLEKWSAPLSARLRSRLRGTARMAWPWGMGS